MASGGDPDVSTGLDELESKLRELEQAFAVLGHEDGEGAPIALPPELEDVPVAPVAPDTGNVQAQINELMRAQERMAATMHALVADVTRIAERLAAPGQSPLVEAAEATPEVLLLAPAIAPAAVVEPTPIPEARSVRDFAPRLPPRWDPRRRGAGPSGPETSGPDTFAGMTVVDVGPIADRGTLIAFHDALARLPGAHDVRVRTYEDDRAVIELRLDPPLELGGALSRAWPTPLTTSAPDPAGGRLVVALEPAPGDGA